MSDSKGYYKFLNLPPNSSIDDVRKAYVRMQRDCNIDNPKVKQMLNNITDEKKREEKKKELAEKAAKLNEIKTILMDEKEKEKYDRGMEFDFRFGDGSSIFDIFGGAMRRQKKVQDTVTEIKLTPKEIYMGVTKKFKIKRNIKCSACNGRGGTNVSTCSACRGTGKSMRESVRGGFRVIEETVCFSCKGEKNIISGDKCKTCFGKKYCNKEEMVTVNIPRGIGNGEKIVFKGKGDELDGCINGDLVFSVEMTGEIKRIGNDIIDSVDIDIYTVLAGGIINYTHLDGQILSIQIQKTKVLQNESICIKGKGFISNRNVGNLYLRPKIIINQNIDYNKLKEIMPPIINVKSGINVSASYDSLPKEQEYEEEDVRERVFRSFGFF